MTWPDPAAVFSPDLLHRALLELPVILATLDAGGIVTRCAGPGLAVAGLDPADLAGRPGAALFGGCPLTAADIRRALGGEALVAVRGLGEHVFEVHYRPGVGPNADECVLVAIDVTGRHRSEQALIDAIRRAEEASLAKSAVMAAISHEVRTPLSGIVGLAGALLDAPLAIEQRQRSETIRGQAQGLLSIVNDLLDYARIEAGRLALEITDLDLDELVEGAVDLFERPARDKGLALTWTIAPDVECRLKGDPGRLRQVLVNLLANAVKFTAQGSVTVTVSAETDHTPGFQTVRFAVTDTGVGLPQEAVRDLLDRLDPANAATPAERGAGIAGLGLAISHNLVAMMGGKVGMESEPGQGSTFWVTARLARRPLETDAWHRDNRLRGIRVLLVDAGEAHRRLVRWLEGWGLAVTALPSALAALQALSVAAGQRHPFPLVLVDHDLPDMTGSQLVSLIEQVPGLAGHRPVLMVPPMSGQAMSGQDGASGIGDDAPAVLVKPFSQSVLFNALVARVGPGDDEPEPATPPAAGPTGREAGRYLRILLAEDDQTNRRVAAKVLERAGHRVDLANDGSEAVEAVRRQPYDLVLMDLQMPVMNGLEAARAIRSLPGAEAAVPIIAITASTLGQDVKDCLAAGMNDFMTKPLARDRLIAVIAHWARPSAVPISPGPLDLDSVLFGRLVEDLGRSDTAEVYATFLAEAGRRLMAIEKAAGRRDVAMLEREVRALHGSAADLGLVRLAGCAAAVAEACRAGHRDGAALLTRPLSEALAAARIALGRQFPEPSP